MFTEEDKASILCDKQPPRRKGSLSALGQDSQWSDDVSENSEKGHSAQPSCLFPHSCWGAAGMGGGLHLWKTKG